MANQERKESRSVLVKPLPTQEDEQPVVAVEMVHTSAQIPITKELIKEKMRTKPYIMAIHNLRRVRDYETPIDKMRCIC